jgi:hypothetical protein
MASFALVSKYGIPPFDWQKVMARLDEIYRPCQQPCYSVNASTLTILLLSSTSILLPMTTCPCQYTTSISDPSSHTNGKLSGSMGLACTRNSSRQLSSVSKLLELLTS